MIVDLIEVEPIIVIRGFAFKQEMDEEAKRAMFPQNARLAAG